MHVSVRTRARIDASKMLTLVVKAQRNRDHRKWWETVPTRGGTVLFQCLVCNEWVNMDIDDTLETMRASHLAHHADDLQAMIDADIWPVPRRQFDRWCDQAGDVPHEIRFEVPCVRWVIIRVLNLATLPLVPVETLQAAIKRAVEDPAFCDALDAAADVPSGITTLLEQQF